MAYSVHNFEQGDVLYANQLNEMDSQIALNEQNINSGVSFNMLAEDYSANKTYSIGDYVIYNNELYTCIYEITTAEGWNSEHWQEENLGDGISELKNAISQLDAEINGSISVPLSGVNLLVQTGFTSSGYDEGNANYFNTRVKSSSFYPVIGGATGTISMTYDENIDPYYSISFYTANNYSTGRISATNWARYETNPTFSIPESATYCRILIKNGSAGTNISHKQFTALSIGDGTNVYNLRFDNPETTLQYGALNSDGTPSSTGTIVEAVTDGFISVNAGDLLVIEAPDGYEVALSYYVVADLTAARVDFVDYATSISTTVPTGAEYMRVSVKKSNSGNIILGQITGIGVKAGEAGLADRVASLEGKEKTGFVIGADCLKRAVNTSELGTLTYAQSFCKYNGKYYSTNGTNVGRQSESFVSETTKALAVGHGNGFQLGSGNIAYVSGWDDQTVYAVNLDTLEIANTITLPTTGYTTAVIDDVNNIAYIFQRDSYPSSIVRYNFIVYDITNSTVVSTRVINAFAAMQAADYYNGKIAILWGLGTLAAPSGMAIYNTVGDIIAQYELSIFDGAEPEGVFIDRDGDGIIVSNYGRKVFQITDIHN